VQKGGVTGFNPYEPPQAPLDAGAAVPATGVSLATRGERLGAAMIDGLIQLAVIVPLQFAFGVYAGFPNVRLSVVQQVTWGVAGFAFYFAVNGYFLFKSAQTVGKKLLRLQIVNFADGAPTPGSKILFARVLPITLAGQIPVVGIWLTFVDGAFIFRAERRCVHDLIAGTKVVKLPALAA
jgi:uncharacterized RDD family membrane protein YckC